MAMTRPSEATAHRTRPSLLRIGLVLILVLYLALATLQSFATRLQWGPDEPAHIIYARSLAIDGRLPALTHTEADDAYVPGAARSHQAHHPPLYYALAALVWRAFSGRADQMVTYTDVTTGQVHTFSVPGPVRPVRFLSVMLGALTLLFAWATARTVFPDRPAVCLAGVALAAFTPMFTYLNGVIINDSLLIAFFSAAAWQWARILRFGAGRKDILLLGLLVGVAINAKETALGLVPLSAIVLALEPGADSWRRRLLNIASIAGLAVALGGWWYARKWAIFGTPLVYAYFAPLLELPDPHRAQVLSLLPATLFLFTFVPVDVIGARANVGLVAVFFAAGTVLSLVGIALTFSRRRKLGLPRYQVVTLVVWLAAAVVVVGGLLRNVLFVDWRMGTAGGRFLVSVLPMLALVSARGLSVLFGDRRGAKVGLVAACLLLLAMNLYAIWATSAGYQTLWFVPMRP